ncbi:hypothetical protein BJF93_07065 [Xaviernesmea oryzae]|uniref:Uncharacterized protein n=1 Tax=Xaviernesmea oryzae TaxID=464029 RepID=A0A1Q9ASD3_9HYPH|nr:hypothetical protein [Xaviernesmea oryzae]OLP58353.1 hypothetical protein BJF93_07065 [Xaviernesmea oryzae]SEL40775.1 hypothetical protein SAMN04487976_1081 [Xaviernesmea oryzae]
MLVCYDVWDRLKGDDDLGYYYPAFTTVAQVREFLQKVQLGANTASGSADVCEAVVDLSRAREGWHVSLCEEPSAWLARMNGMH